MSRSSLNKIQMIVADHRLRNILAQAHSRLRLSEVLSNRDILIVQIPIDQFGTTKVSTIGTLILAQLALYLSHNSYPFHVYIDDAHYFQTPVLIHLLQEAGHHQVSLTVVSRYLAELKSQYTEAFLGLIGRVTAFRLGITDGVRLSQALGIPPNNLKPHEIMPHHAYFINAHGCNLESVAPIPHHPTASIKTIRNRSRRSYASQRHHIEPKINKFITRR